jgi:hypothetical protein
MSIKTLSKMPKCKRCDHTPSIAGKEPMYLVPYGNKYYVICGGCQGALLDAMGKRVTHELDFHNLYSYLDGYHNFVGTFLGITK